MVINLVSQMKHAGSNSIGDNFFTCLKVISLLRKLFFMHKQACHNNKRALTVSQDLMLHLQPPELSVFSSNHAPQFIGPIH